MSEPLSRREVLMLSGATFAALAFGFRGERGDISPLGYELSPRIYQLPEGRIPLVHYRVLPGDSVGKVARYWNTRSSLIIEANGLYGKGIHPDDDIKIPAYANLPFSYLPEVGIIRHQLDRSDTPAAIARLYRIPEQTVQDSYADADNFFRGPTGIALIVRGAVPPPITPVEIGYQGDDMIAPDVIGGLIHRLTNIVVSETKDARVANYVRKRIRVEYGATGFKPPNIITARVDDQIGEGTLMRSLGHELWHWFPFPWWSSGADEGSAGYFASEWATRFHREYAPDPTIDRFYDPGYYNNLNTPILRGRVFSNLPVENRILATEAWRRIEERYPGIVATLLRAGANEEDAGRNPHSQWPVAMVQNWVSSNYGGDAWGHIEDQHILFTE